MAYPRLKRDDVFPGCENNPTKGNHPFFPDRFAYDCVSLMPDFTLGYNLVRCWRSVERQPPCPSTALALALTLTLAKGTPGLL